MTAVVHSEGPFAFECRFDDPVWHINMTADRRIKLHFSRTVCYANGMIASIVEDGARVLRRGEATTFVLDPGSLIELSFSKAWGWGKDSIRFKIPAAPQ